MSAGPVSGSFKTSAPGASEAQWNAWSREFPAWRPPPRPLVVVAPHPDDETLGAGGLMSTWAGQKLPITVISVTDGEAACPEVSDLAAVRRRELSSAMGELVAANADIVRLELPDGGVDAFEAKLTRLISDVLPLDAILVAPFEFDGHPDHDATGRAARAAALTCGALLVRYPIWAWYRGSPQLLAEPNIVRFELSEPVQRAKQRAIDRFSSQIDDRPGGAIVPPHVRNYFSRPYEVFVL